MIVSFNGGKDCLVILYLMCVLMQSSDFAMTLQTKFNSSRINDLVNEYQAIEKDKLRV